MKSETYATIIDKAGFPLLLVPKLGLYVHLYPIMKIQLEQWLVQDDTPGNKFYDEAQIIRDQIENAQKKRRGQPTASAPEAPKNERISWRHINGTPLTYTRLIATGITPEEALQFSSWLGQGYDFPTVTEWQQIARLWKRENPLINIDKSSGMAKCVHKALFEHLTPQTLYEQSLMHKGIMEWTWQNENRTVLGWMGQPSTMIFPSTFNPLKQMPPAPHNTNIRLFIAGFRLVWRGQHG